MPRNVRPPRREREAPQYKTVPEILKEAITHSGTVTEVAETMLERLVIVVRTDHPDNRV